MGNSTCDIHILLPPDKRKWYIFLAITIVLYVSGLLAILIGRLLIRCSTSKNKKKSKNVHSIRKEWYLKLINFTGKLESGQNLPGKVLIAVSFLANMAAFVIYIIQSHNYPVEYCIDLSEDYNIYAAEMILYFFFLFHFFVRFISATDRLMFWTLDIYTYIDLLTFPLVFHIWASGSAWLGFRFLRVVYIIRLPLMLNYLNLLRDGSTLGMGYIVGKFFALLLSSAGMIHLLENTGDFWDGINYSNNRLAKYEASLNYFDCVYFMVVTLSTVGYGDISCGTYLGQFFSILVIIFGLGLFATYVPIIFEFVSSHTKYDQAFKTTAGKKHVVVAGHVTDETVMSFIQDFLHPDRELQNTSIVFISPNHPSIVIQSYLQRFSMNVSYFIGTVYKHCDCERVQMGDASAVILLCNKKASNPESEDAGNITRIVLLKKFYPEVRCIVQLLRKESRFHLLNCPQWKGSRDSIVCIDELKLGFMAQSCNAPGFSTLLANLFVMRSNEGKEVYGDWKDAYMHGVSCELYSCKLSNYFIDMAFPDVVEICFERLQILLIAVEVVQNKKKVFAINPSEKLKITEHTVGYFCAQEYRDVARVKFYQGDQSGDNVEVKIFSKCLASSLDTSSSSETLDSTVFIQISGPDSPENRGNIQVSTDLGGIHVDVHMDRTESIVDEDSAMFDETGTYFWCEKQLFRHAIMTLEQAESEKFVGHVVILVISDKHAPSLGLKQLIQPLRASNQPACDLKKIIILGDVDFLAREWLSIANFPDVHIVEGSPYCRVDLRAINVHTADMCILLSPRQTSFSNGIEHEAVSDKEVIMVTLNLRAMTFEALDNIMTSSPNTSLSRSPRCQTKQQHELLTTRQQELQNKVHSISGENITLITELVYDSNTLYMDDDIKSAGCEDCIYMTQSYACGSVFTVSVLDFLASATYFNSDILKLVRNLVTGSVNPELDKMLREGKQPNGVPKSKQTEEIAAVRNRCRVEQLSLDNFLFSGLGRLNEYGELFLKSLKTHRMLCLGLYRLHTTQTLSSKSLSTRYVITFPPKDMQLIQTDLVFVLMQFDSSTG